MTFLGEKGGELGEKEEGGLMILEKEGYNMERFLEEISGEGGGIVPGLVNQIH